MSSGSGTSGRPPPRRRPSRAHRWRSRDPEQLAAEIVARLNPEQARAVTTTEGPLLILAGAGSGKTRVLAHRVAYLIGVKGVRPWKILAVTFTNKAAGEMRERIIGLVGDEAGRQVAMGTFHSLCARVLRRDGRAIGIDPRFTVYDTDDQTSLMKQVLRELDLVASGETRPAAMLGAGQPLEERPGGARRGDRDRAHATTSSSPPGPMPPTRSACARPAASTSTTCSTRPSASSSRRRTCWAPTRPSGATSTSTSTRTRTARSTSGSGSSPRIITTWPWSATTTRASTAGAGRTCATSSTSSATTPRRRSSSWSRTTARPSHPRRRPCGRLAQRGPQGQEALDRERPWRPHRALRGRPRGRGGGMDRPPDRRARPGPRRRRLDPRPSG